MYREPLPVDCPPDKSEEIVEPLIVYRLVRNSPPTNCDFRSQRAERPNKVFHGVPECITRGLSVYTDISQSIQMRNRRRNLRGMMICKVMLVSGAGRIEQTFKEPTHYTWWPLADFDIMSNCSVV